jgi:titin
MCKNILVFSIFALLLLAASVVHAQAASLSLSFTDNASNETGFDVERCQGSGCSGFAKVAGLGVNVTTYVDSSLLEGTMYCYRVRAVNSGGASAYSNTSCATTLVAAPAAPSNLLVK